MRSIRQFLSQSLLDVSICPTRFLCTHQFRVQTNAFVRRIELQPRTGDRSDAIAVLEPRDVHFAWVEARCLSPLFRLDVWCGFGRSCFGVDVGVGAAAAGTRLCLRQHFAAAAPRHLGTQRSFQGYTKSTRTRSLRQQFPAAAHSTRVARVKHLRIGRGFVRLIDGCQTQPAPPLSPAFIGQVDGDARISLCPGQCPASTRRRECSQGRAKNGIETISVAVFILVCLQGRRRGPGSHGERIRMGCLGKRL